MYGMDTLLGVSGVISIMTGSRAGCQPQLHIRINWGVPEKDRSPGPCPEPAGHNLWAGPWPWQLELHGQPAEDRWSWRSQALSPASSL